MEGFVDARIEREVAAGVSRTLGSPLHCAGMMFVEEIRIEQALNTNEIVER